MKKLSIITYILILSFTVFMLLIATEDQATLNLVARFYFDDNYYLKTYPDINQSEISPFKHYSEIGWKEGKNPSRNFDNNFYIRMNNYRKKMGDLNPLQHYVKCKLLLYDDCYSHPEQIKKVKLLENPKYYLALVSIFRDEARFLKEWIEFYKLMGVEHFYLYNHLSTDEYLEVLAPYIKDGTVELETLTTQPNSNAHWNNIQTAAYNEAVAKTRDIAEWLIVVDSDEFVFPVRDNDLKDVLKKYDDYATLSFNYRNFGSGDIKKIQKNELLIEKLIMAEALGDTHTSPVVKSRYVECFNNPHFAKLKSGYAQVTENFEYMKGHASPYQSFNVIKANHYWGRDLQFFYDNKVNRVHLIQEDLTLSKADILMQRELKISQLRDLNKKRSIELDDSIVRFVPALRAHYNKE